MLQVTPARALPAALLALFVALNIASADGRLSGDDHYALWSATSIRLGDLPSRDFHDPGSPLQSLLSAAGQLASGGRPIAEIVLTNILRALGLTCVYLLAVRTTGTRAAALAVSSLVALLALPAGLYGADKMLIYPLAGLLAWRYLEDPRRTWVLGALAGVAFLFRHDHGVYVGAPLGLAVLLSGRSPVPFVAAGLIVVAPWLAWAHVHEGLPAYFTTRLNFARLLGLASARPGFGFTAGEYLTQENALRLLWQLAVVTSAAALLTAIWLRDRARAVVGCLAALAAAGLMRELGNYPETATVWMPLGGWLAVRARRPAARIAAAAAALVTAAAVIFVTDSTTRLPQIALGGGGLHTRIASAVRLHTTVPPIDVYAPADVADERLIVRYVYECLAPADRIWDTSVWFPLSYYAERRLVDHPFWDRGFRRELDARIPGEVRRLGMPPLVIVRDKEHALDAFALYPETRRFVGEEFEEISSAKLEAFRAEVENVRLLKYRGREAVGRFEPLDLPCFVR